MNSYLESTPIPLRVAMTEGLRIMCDTTIPMQSRHVGSRFVRVILQYLLNHVVCPHQTHILHHLYELTSLSPDFDTKSRELLYLLQDEVLREAADPYFMSLCHSLATTVEAAIGDYQYYGRHIRD